jgi:hypothetical protein
MGDLHRRGHAINHDDLVAPVELVSLAGIEAQRHVGRRQGFALRPRPRNRIAPHGIVAALVTERPKLLEDPDMCQSLTLRLARVIRQHPVKLIPPWPDPRLRLDAALIGELCRA